MSDRRYAERTKVPVTQSRNEIEAMVKKFGAHQVLSYEDKDRAIVQFMAHGRMIRFTLELPEKTEPAESRRCWRALVLLVKSKITAVTENIVTFEQEFLGNVVMADGKTVHEHARETIRLSYESGVTQTLLPDFSKGT